MLVLGCGHPPDQMGNTYIVPNDSILILKRTLNQHAPQPPPKEYYFPSNFIIDTGDHIYYYQQKINSLWYCVTEKDWNTPPSFIDLQPKDIVEVPTGNLVDFINANIQYFGNSDRLFAISSVLDTITSPGLTKIFSIFKNKTNEIDWTFRRTTPEEDTVLWYKKSKQKYHSDEIKWDSSKTLFPPNLENIKFTPPRID